MNDTTDKAHILDTPNVYRAKEVHWEGERSIRLYLDDDWDLSTVEYADPDGALYEAFRRKGVEVS